ncbi:2-C-methyl-D-erythritol 4-phosphate cytidylyltransferase [Caloramator australicus]|uniref:2-C-methyl-D-erythritol 4-phosphate cytidylyltransferase n=1 Tax=Caloramator australicus RC3 TaxID=857293 RepID=G0V3X3_9CLOT|nr:2-C-methyl-D-erythritol 4-phosphate cytidylyltransferase [Caloramator australicus]CCC57813.1 2-C-methyl-D-erythritol 4-phosphate cytidylyltransferase [Caloramator australicus RC3]
MISAIVVAAGKGKRMGLGFNKLYAKINNKEIIAITLEKFEKSNYVDEIIAVVAKDEVDYFKINILDKYCFKKVKITEGGIERQNSVYNGLIACNNPEIVLIHDGARPNIDDDIIKRSIDAAKSIGAATVAVPVIDTIKIVEDGYSVETLERKKLYAIQTPQSFKYDLILKAHEYAIENKIIATDDTQLVEKIGHKVKIIEGSYENIKVTTPKDIILLNSLAATNL